MSDASEQNSEGRSLTVIVRWIGWHLELSRSIQPITRRPIDGLSKKFLHGPGDKYQFDIYGLTVEGRAICVQDYCVRLANNKSTHVVLLQDKKMNIDSQVVGEEDIDWGVAFNELKLRFRPGLDRFQSFHCEAWLIGQQMQEIQKRK